MNIPDTATLRKALEITIKIERLQEELHLLLAGSTSKPVEKLPPKKRLSKKNTASLPKVKTSEVALDAPVFEPAEPFQKLLQDELLLADDTGIEPLALRPTDEPALESEIKPAEESCSLVF